MKVKDLTASKWDRDIEASLRNRLLRRGFHAYRNVRASDVIDRLPGEVAPLEDGLFRTMGFSFVVTKGTEGRPQFAVEFEVDSPQRSPSAAAIDALQNRLCAQANLPLLRVSSQHLERHEQVSLLDWLLERWIAWQDERSALVEDLQQQCAAAREALGDDADDEDMIDYVDDPGVLFHLRHPYPAVLTLSRRLLRLGIVTEHARAMPRTRGAGAELRASLKWCHRMGHGCAPDGEWVTIHCRWEVFDSEFRLENPEYVAESSVRTRWALSGSSPIDVDEDQAVQILHGNDLAGASPWDIAEGLADYVALQEIESWAKASEEGAHERPSRE